MGGTNGSRGCEPDDRLRDTYRIALRKHDGFAALYPSYRLPVVTSPGSRFACLE